MEHADTAQLAAVGGALGSVLVLLARGRVTLLAGLLVGLSTWGRWAALDTTAVAVVLALNLLSVPVVLVAAQI